MWYLNSGGDLTLTVWLGPDVEVTLVVAVPTWVMGALFSGVHLPGEALLEALRSCSIRVRDCNSLKPLVESGRS